MADQQSNAPTSGVIHVRTRLTANFTVISNRLAQRGGSAVTLGVATYILSLPDGAPVSIAALCAHFTEGEVLIARALRELEAAGYLERRRERVAGGLICTRTFAYDVPCAAEDPRPKPRPSRRAKPTPAAKTSTDTSGWQQEPAEPRTEAASPEAVAVLTSLRQRDRRLTLSEREVDQLAAPVKEWLDQGVDPREIADTLSAGLPARINQRPARLLAYRLHALRPTVAPDPNEKPYLHVLPLQTCDGCERAFRAPEPRLCRDCQGDTVLRATA